MQVAARKVDFSAPIADLFFVGNQYKGEVGLEVEVEGHNLPHNIPSYWVHHQDGSLRGPENAEYVLKQPCLRRSVPKFLKYLKEQLDKNKAQVLDSNRTSVHVHLNMANKSLTQCFTTMILYFLFEDAMSNIAGESRVGNLFCLRAGDAELFVDALADCARKRRFGLDPDRFRYTSVNACAITKFNSIEFRALRGTVDPDVITEWVNLLLAIKDASEQFQSPVDVLEAFSRLGPRGMVDAVFGPRGGLLTAQRNFEQSMWDNARLVQEIAYATDWSEIKKPKRVFALGEDDED